MSCNWLANPKHPLWKTIDTAMVLLFITAVLAMNASNFDHTEVRTILELGVMLAGWQSIKQIAEKRKGSTDE